MHIFCVAGVAAGGLVADRVRRAGAADTGNVSLALTFVARWAVRNICAQAARGLVVFSCIPMTRGGECFV